MFNQTFTRSYTGYERINSTCVEYMNIDALKGKVTVLYTDGGVYTYKNVSKRACLKFLLDKGARSMGKFVNNVLLEQRCNVKQWLTA